MKPLLFDTSAAFAPKTIRKLREKYPERRFMLPSVVIAERLNQLRRKHRGDFDVDLVSQFITNPHFSFLQVAFDRAAAEALAEIAFRLGDAWYPRWPEEKRDVRLKPCGNRCRWADHAITALAIANEAVLVTEDQEILKHCLSDLEFYPEATRVDALL